MRSGRVRGALAVRTVTRLMQSVNSDSKSRQRPAAIDLPQGTARPAIEGLIAASNVLNRAHMAYGEIPRTDQGYRIMMLWTAPTQR
jgi:hypothetical protein